MIRPLALLLAATALAATPAAAFQAQQERDTTPREILDGLLDRILGPEREDDPAADPGDPGEEPVASPSLDMILAADFRAEDRPRDAWRHPAETLEFFRVEPGMTVAEYSPGGGWYSRILAPYIAPEGRYLAVNRDTGENADADAQAWPTRFPVRIQQMTGVPAAAVTAFESDEIPAGLEGAADRILIFRNVHSLLNAGAADSELRNLRQLLAEDGLIGVVQHRAPETATWERANGSRGYVKQSDVVALFDLHGFELVQASEVNANPRDTAGWDRGVWTLPPTLALGDENRARYEAIGESDRMTLLFRKAD